MRGGGVDQLAAKLSPGRPPLSPVTEPWTAPTELCVPPTPPRAPGELQAHHVCL